MQGIICVYLWALAGTSVSEWPCALVTEQPSTRAFSLHDDSLGLTTGTTKTEVFVTHVFHFVATPFFSQLPHTHSGHILGNTWMENPCIEHPHSNIDDSN